MRYRHLKALLKLVDKGLLIVRKSGVVTWVPTGRVWENEPNRKGGYTRVHIYSKGKPLGAFAHVLVWFVYKGPVPEGLEINHKSGIKHQNWLSNLEVITHQENIEHASINGLLMHGNDHVWSKLTDKQVRRIRRQFSIKEIRIEALSKKYGVVQRTIKKMLLGITWKHVAGAISREQYDEILKQHRPRNSKYTKEEVVALRKRFRKAKITTKNLGIELQSDQTALRDLLTGRYWPDVPGVIPKEKYIELNRKALAYTRAMELT